MEGCRTFYYFLCINLLT